MNGVITFTIENEIYFCEIPILLEFHPPTEFARDAVLYIVVRSLSSEQNVIKPIKFNGQHVFYSTSYVHVSLLFIFVWF